MTMLKCKGEESAKGTRERRLANLRTKNEIKEVMKYFVSFLLNVLVKKISHVGTEPPLPGYYQYFWE